MLPLRDGGNGTGAATAGVPYARRPTVVKATTVRTTGRNDNTATTGMLNFAPSPHSGVSASRACPHKCTKQGDPLRSRSLYRAET